MIAYGKNMWRKKIESWLNLDKIVKRIKLLQLIGKESRRGFFLRGIKEKDQTTEMEEDQIRGMTEGLITGSKEDQTREDKTEALILKGSNALVAKDLVT